MHSFLGYVDLVVYPIIRLSYLGSMIVSVGMRSPSGWTPNKAIADVYPHIRRLINDDTNASQG
ncbi:MAG: hypothetical protein RM368_36455 [Nostoc sp. DedSLP03]|nr:hypothetical protein [Nostoc sp. DedSLP03]